MREELFKQITDEMFELWKRKNTDYGSSVSDTYKDFGIVSFLVRMQDKMNRLKTITKNEALVNHPKVSVTPHIGAATKEAQERIGEEVVTTISDFVANSLVTI